MMTTMTTSARTGVETGLGSIVVVAAMGTASVTQFSTTPRSCPADDDQRAPAPATPIVTRATGDQIAIQFTAPTTGPVDLKIFDLRGRLVRRLAARDFPAGQHALQWDGRDSNGHQVANGIYIVRMSMSGESHSSKTLWMR